MVGIVLVGSVIHFNGHIRYDPCSIKNSRLRVVFVMFGRLIAAGKRIQAKDIEHYGWLERTVVYNRPLSIGLAVGWAVLTVTAIWIVAAA